MWTAVSAVLTLPSAAGDPLLAMLVSPNLAVAVPVAVLSIGAIGTTLIASYLALSGFCTDALCALAGRCTLNDARNARALAVALPALLACGGPDLYLPLLAFAGAFPTTLLYGLVPPLAALALRRARSGRAPADAAPDSGSTPRRLLGGGTPVLGALVAVAAGFILTAAVLAAAAGRGAALHLA